MPSLWNRQRAAHLYRRAGFGATPEELDLAVSAGREGAVDRLVNFETIPTTQLDNLLASYRFDLTTFYTSDDERGYSQFTDLQRWWYLRMVYTPRPLEEKLTLFWHNHFASSFSKVDLPPLLYAQNNLFRRLCAGRFGTLLLEVAKDPAMLFYLDNNTNVKDNIQENWGRELLELFTMGVNQYTQSDVRAAATAFTGWTTESDPPYRFVFDPEQHDFGLKTFLGRTGNFDGGDIITLLSERPETAEFLTSKLGRFFLGRNPRRGLARRLQQVFLASDGDIKSLVRAILESGDFDESAGRNDQIKSPTELFVGAVRALRASTDGSGLANYALLAGQVPFAPPNVAGWPALTYGGYRWFNTGAYVGRLNFANDLAGARPGTEGFSWDHRSFFPPFFPSSDALINFLADRFHLAGSSANLRQALRNYLGQMGLFQWNLDEVADRYGRGAVKLLLSSPDYQLQ